MSGRAFTVFVDTPSDSQQSKPSSPPKSTPSSSFSNISLVSSALTPVDKENYNPVTGERAGFIATAGKKRKGSISNVLATKLYAPAEEKVLKDKDSSDAQPEAKKRKSSASRSSSSSKNKAKKDAKGSVLGKKVMKKPTRRTSPMPKVEEEDAEERTRITQIRIDSKCYDYTVSPLADVSEAYGEVPILGGAVTESPAVKSPFQFVKEVSADPEIRDYFDPQLSVSSSSTTLRGSSPAEPKTFSTPERKQLYSSFTFTLPSPTSDRLRKAARAGSVPRLDFGEATKVSP